MRFSGLCATARSSRSIAWFVLLLTAPIAHAQSRTYLVGGDAIGCDFSSIQAAINQAQAHPGPDTIRVAKNLTYSSLALKVGAQDVTIQGGFATCVSTTVESASAKTVLSGAGGAADSVIEFTGRGTRIVQGLAITRGDDPTSGGGIQHDGSGELLLENVEIYENASAYGGGINFHGSGSALAFLVLGQNVDVHHNIASESGGGIRLTGQARLEMIDQDTQVRDNQALGASSDQSGHGGGIVIVGPAQARIAAPTSTQATLSGNAARYGGGLAVIAPDEDASVLLYSVDALRPLRIANNRALVAGGGIYVGGNHGGTFGAYVAACVDAHTLHVDDNRAPSGAAIYVNEMAGFNLNGTRLVDGSQCFVLQPPPFNAVSCVQGDAPACSRIAGNRSEDSAGRITAGAIVAARNGNFATAWIERAAMTGNVGGAVLESASCSNCLIAENQANVGLGIYPRRSAEDGVAHEIISSTIASNTIGGHSVLRIGNVYGVTLRSSILMQPDKTVYFLDGPGSSFGPLDVMVSDCGTIDCYGFTNVFAPIGGPRFVDPQQGNYRLQAASAAVDATGGSITDTDLDGNPRVVELVPRSVAFGRQDLGAYERQTLEPLVRNGDFAVNTGPWRVGIGVTAELHGGGVLIAKADGGRLGREVIGLTQCVPLPMAGDYRLTGLAAGQGFLAHSRDRVEVRWRYYARSAGSECAGTPTRIGALRFPNSAGLSAPIADDLIVVAPGEFSERTELLIELVAIEGNVTAVNDSTGGMFDGIRLVAPTSAAPR